MTVTRIQFRRGTAEAWEAANPVLAVSERGFQLADEDYPQGRWKTGDGVTNWLDLAYEAAEATVDTIVGASDAGRAVLGGTPTEGLNALGAAKATDVSAIAGQVKAGDAWWNTVFAPPVADDTPTSVSVATTGAIVGGTTITPSTDYGADPNFRYDGCVAVTTAGTGLVAAVQPSGGATYALVPEFVTSPGCDKVDVIVKTNSSGNQIGLRLTINGRWLTLPLTWHTATANTVYYIRLAFPSAKARSIRVESVTTASFGGVIVPAGETVLRPTQDVRKRLVVWGDSYVKGANGNSTTDPATNGCSQFETFPNYVAKLLGCDSLINLGVGGTGWSNPGSAAVFGVRVGDILAASPHMVIAAGSRNDNSYTGSQVFSAAVAALTQLVDTPVVEVCGLEDDGSGTGTAPSVLNEAVKAAARTVGFRFNDMLGVVTSGDKNSADNVHPSVLGAQKLAKAFYASLDRSRTDERIAAAVGGRASSDVVLTSSPLAASNTGDSVTFTATLSSHRAGKVVFYSDNAVLATSTVTAAVATYTTSALPIGAHTITARFIPTNPILVKPVTSNAMAFSVSANLGFVDHFSVDVSPLASTENGKAYLAGGAGTGVGAASGGVATITGVSSGTRYYVVDAGTPNGTLSVKLGGTVTGAVIPIRYVDGSNLLRVTSQSSQVVLQQTVSNVTTTLFTGSGGNWASSDVISVEISGDTLTVKKNGTGIPGLIGVTTSQFNSATRFGIGATSSGGALTYDDLSFVA